MAKPLDTTKPATNAAQILRLIGCDKLDLRRGSGYWYFVYDDEARNIWHDESVPVCYLSQASINFWVGEGKRIVAEVEAKAAEDEAAAAAEPDPYTRKWTEAAAPVPYYERPCAAEPLTSYRYTGRFGFVMLGAMSGAGALEEARRSLTSEVADVAKLEVWKDGKYTPVNGGTMKVDFKAIEDKAKEYGGWYDHAAEKFRFPTPYQANQFEQWLAQQKTA